MFNISSLDNLLEASSESTIGRPPRRRYNLRYNRSPTPFLASKNSSLVRHHAQPRSSDSVLAHENIQTSGLDSAFLQRSSNSSDEQSGELFLRPSSPIHSVLLSDSLLLNIDITTDQYSTLPTHNRVDSTDTPFLLFLVHVKILDSYILQLIKYILILKYLTDVVEKNFQDSILQVLKRNVKSLLNFTT